MDNKKVLIAMSGGVDSTVCAHLIKEAGYYTEGITMKLWSQTEEVTDSDNTSPDQNCSDASFVASQIGIPHRSIALGSSFKKNVVNSFISEYINGYTPNPCVECNKHIKFGTLFDISDKLGFDYLATGHYARIEQVEDGCFVLKKAKDSAKDQSYFLWSIKKERLPRILFPLGNYTKQEIRAIAEEHKYQSAKRSDSQDICFIPDGDYVSFIKSQTDMHFTNGNFVSPDGKILGQHNGIINYTIGQRKGLGIALGQPAFVCKKDVKSNTVTLCSDKELYTDTLTAHSLNFLIDEALEHNNRYEVKIRYRHNPVWATVKFADVDRLQIIFDQPQRAVTPGQSVVLYDGDIVVGGGIID